MKNERPAGFLDSEHPQRKFYYCYGCGKPFWKPDAFRKIYCCPECQKEAQAKARCKKVKPPRKSYEKVCAWCGKGFTANNKNQKYCCKECGYEGNKRLQRQRWAEAFVPQTKICKECGTEFMTECGDKHSVFCCRSCAEKHERRAEHGTKRHRIYMRGMKKKRQQQIAKTDKGDVDYNSLYERDNGICQICGLDVHPEKNVSNNWDGTIDHIIPLSLGGEHTIGNCQLAHRLCNSIKLQEGSEFFIDWEEKSKENNYWNKKFEDYKNLMGACPPPGPVSISV